MIIQRFDNVLDIDLVSTIAIVYGNTLDQFIIPHQYSILTLDRAIGRYLKAKAFDLVVFFDAAWQLHCYDLDTYKFFKEKARGKKASEIRAGAKGLSYNDQRPLGTFSLLKARELPDHTWESDPQNDENPKKNLTGVLFIDGSGGAQCFRCA